MIKLSSTKDHLVITQKLKLFLKNNVNIIINCLVYRITFACTILPYGWNTSLRRQLQTPSARPLTYTLVPGSWRIGALRGTKGCIGADGTMCGKGAAGLKGGIGAAGTVWSIGGRGGIYTMGFIKP